jgi:proteasome lid subunit RPN8/RPN11
LNHRVIESLPQMTPWLDDQIFSMLRISQRELDALRRHGEQTYPYECCGVLLGGVEGDDRVVRQVAPCVNTRADRPQDRYDIDPRELVKIQRQARERGLDIVGFYHSHPDHPARWSATDLAEAHWIGCSYVITSVEQGRAALTNSFLLAGSSEEDKRFVDEEIEVASPEVTAESPTPAQASVRVKL